MGVHATQNQVVEDGRDLQNGGWRTIGLAFDSCEELLEPQPLSAKISATTAILENAKIPFEPFAIATCSHTLMMHAERERLLPEFTKTAFGRLRKPRYLSLTDRKLCVPGLRRVCP